jgi:large subunit ribosomal protein L25
MSDFLTTEKREGAGTREAKQVRSTGRVPVVLYGHKEANAFLSVTHDEIMAVLKHGGKVVDLKGAVSEKAMVREVQWDTYGKEVLHVDLARVSASEVVKATVSIELRGTAAGQKSGGHIEFIRHEIDIKCPVLSVPDKIVLNITALELDGHIYAKDVPLPQGATLVTTGETLVLQCVAAKLVDDGPLGGNVAEPEVIKKAKEDKEDAKG